MIKLADLDLARFLLGAADAHQFPQDEVVEIAIAGRSNVGKSTAINCLARQHKLARTSKSPGRTQEINFFAIHDAARLVDLPGYGFARIPDVQREKISKLIFRYLRERENLLLLILLMDSRHPLTDLDREMVTWVTELKIPTQVLLTKADKLSANKRSNITAYVESQLKEIDDAIEVMPFSASKRIGVDELREQFVEWVNGANG